MDFSEETILEDCFYICKIFKEQHLFLSYTIFVSLWNLMRSWIGVSLIDPYHIQDHFL